MLPILTAVVGGLVGASGSYFFALRKDREERRRERIVAHLIEAYRNLEASAGRCKLNSEQTKHLESSIGAIFPFGSEEATRLASKLADDVAEGKGSMNALLRVLRQDLRSELGLSDFEADLKFLRFRQGKSTSD